MKLTEREPTEKACAKAYNQDVGDYENDALGYYEDIWTAMHDASDDGGLLDLLLAVVRAADEIGMIALDDALAALRAHPKADEVLKGDE